MRTARRWLTVIAAAGGLLIAGSPAIAAEAGPAATSQALTGAGLKAVPSAAQAPSAPFHLCLTNTTNPRFCIQSNGTGQPVTITSNQANWSNFQTVYTFSNGGITWNQIENGNGNCLRAGTNNIVKIENGPCVHSDNADSWSGETIGPKDYQSYMWGDWMLVHGNMNGYKVWHAEPVSGDWTNWGALLA